MDKLRIGRLVSWAAVLLLLYLFIVPLVRPLPRVTAELSLPDPHGDVQLLVHVFSFSGIYFVYPETNSRALVQLPDSTTTESIVLSRALPPYGPTKLSEAILAFPRSRTHSFILSPSDVDLLRRAKTVKLSAEVSVHTTNTPWYALLAQDCFHIELVKATTIEKRVPVERPYATGAWK